MGDAVNICLPLLLSRKFPGIHLLDRSRSVSKQSLSCQRFQNTTTRPLDLFQKIMGLTQVTHYRIGTTYPLCNQDHLSITGLTPHIHYWISTTNSIQIITIYPLWDQHHIHRMGLTTYIFDLLLWLPTVNEDKCEKVIAENMIGQKQ